VLGALGGVRVVDNTARRLSLELTVTAADANVDAEVEAETEETEAGASEAKENQTSTVYTLHLERGHGGSGGAFESVRIEPSSAPATAATADVIAHFLRSSAAASSSSSSVAVISAPSSQPLAFLVRETRARLALMQRRGAEISKLAARCACAVCCLCWLPNRKNGCLHRVHVLYFACAIHVLVCIFSLWVCDVGSMFVISSMFLCLCFDSLHARRWCMHEFGFMKTSSVSLNLSLSIRGWFFARTAVASWRRIRPTRVC
jgi:hypothetical protein